MRPVAYIKQNLTNLAEIPIGWADKWRSCDSVKSTSATRTLKISTKNSLYDYCDVFFSHLIALNTASYISQG